jgi:hypothetical protein
VKLDEHLSKADPNVLADILRKINLAQVLRGQVPQFLRRKVPAAGVQLATLETLVLADDAKASSIVRATVRAGGVTGELTPQTYGTTPATTQIAVAPNGDIAVLAADAITDIDVHYLPERGDVYETTMPVVSDVLTPSTTFTASPRGIVLLLEAEAVDATSTGDKVVLVPGAGAPAAGQARLNVAKTTVTFAAADAVTRARVKFLLVALQDLDALLEAEATV